MSGPDGKLTEKAAEEARAENAAGEGAAPPVVNHPYESRHPDGHDWDRCKHCRLYIGAHPTVLPPEQKLP